jgi:glutamate--cysteine ligase
MSGEEALRELTSVDDLVGYFRDAETPREEFRIGTEHEKIGVYTDDHRRVPYEGERGIGAVLEKIATVDGWERVFEGENVIALLKDGASITLEPGGQFELSGAPLDTIGETCSELHTHLDLMKRISEEFGIAWLAIGADPLHPVARIPHMPKGRYAIMREYLPTRGDLALDMMYATATVQANFDYSSEADMASKLRMAMGCSAIVSAMFANSPLSEGRENGFASQRVAVWQDMDPDRCGLLPFVFDANFGYRQYAEWALDVPMFFIVRGHRYIPGAGTSFRQFMQNGFAGERATLADWDLHLTTLFPEVRLKRFIEVRGADVVPADLICSLPALWKGLLYDDQACSEAWELVAGWSFAEREAALPAVARAGLAAEVAGQPVLGLARRLVEISDAGLGRLAQGSSPDERPFLDALRAQLELGKSPGEVLLERWRGEWGSSAERLIEHTRY